MSVKISKLIAHLCEAFPRFVAFHLLLPAILCTDIVIFIVCKFRDMSDIEEDWLTNVVFGLLCLLSLIAYLIMLIWVFDECSLSRTFIVVDLEPNWISLCIAFCKIIYALFLCCLYILHKLVLCFINAFLQHTIISSTWLIATLICWQIM